MRAFTGTWRLFRLALRRDRVKLPIIMLVVIGMFVSSAQATIDFYGQSQDDINKYVATTAPSAVSRVFSGPIGGANIGAVVMNETFTMMLIGAAFVSSMAIVRHTRQNEEFGRSELIESGVVSRHASLTAALLLALLINIVFAVLMFGSLVGLELPVAGSLYASLAVFAVGMSFAGLAAVAAQLADSGRGANAYGALMIGAAFLLRGIGDVGGKMSADGTSVQSGFLSWLSPFGWAQQIFPYDTQRLWIFWLLAALVIASISLAVYLMTKRDIGMGMISTRPGRATAQPSLLSVVGLTVRLQRGILRGWAIAIVVFGGIFGLTIKEFEGFLADNEEMQEIFAQYGSGGHRDILLAVLISMMAIMVAGYAVQALLRARSEESGGQLENVFGASVSRITWLLSHVGFVVAGIVSLLMLTALSMGLSYVISVGGSFSELWSIMGAAFVQGAAVLTFSGFVIAVFGLLPRLVVPIAWGAFAIALLIVQIGALLKLPQMVMNISPFVHLPALPASDFQLEPVLWLTGIGVLLCVVGFVCFSRRDLVTE